MTTLPQTMRGIVMREAGGPDVLEMATLGVPQPRAGEVLIQVAAAGVNGPDLVQRRGHYPPPKGASPHLGLEVSGTVAALGEGVSQWSLGDAACALTNGGGYADYVAVDASHVVPVPQGVDLVDAAGLCETYFTVWSNVFFGHQIPEGGNFLVHGGAGGIGSTAIQLGAAKGLRVLTTVEARDKDFVLGLGATTAIDFREEDFVELTRAAGGADIVLDIIGGPYVARNIKACRHDGRMIQLAFNGGSKVEIDLMPVMLKRLSYTGATLRSRPESFKSAVAADLALQVWPLFANGKLKAVTHTVLPLEQAAQAHVLMESAGQQGKILLQM